MSYTDDYGDRMKAYEAVETSRRLDKSLPIYARIDGRAFHTFTRDLQRPFDPHLLRAMSFTTKVLVEKTHALIGYVQSDEISLIWEYSSEAEPLFSGKVHKLTSVLASLATAAFIRDIDMLWNGPETYIDKMPHFDCRVFNLPSRMEAANMLLWRAMDARKNSISMVAQSKFSHKELQGKSQSDMHRMLLDIGVNFAEEYPLVLTDGRFFRRQEVWRELTKEELARIPVAHVPNGPVQRTEVAYVEMPTFNTVKNRVEVIFEGADPVT